LAVRQPREEDAHWSEGAHDFYVSIFGGVEHLRGRSMFATWKKSYCPIGADRYDCESMRILSVPVYD
jgi:hypothetical protein